MKGTSTKQDANHWCFVSCLAYRWQSDIATFVMHYWLSVKLMSEPMEQKSFLVHLHHFCRAFHAKHSFAFPVWTHLSDLVISGAKENLRTTNGYHRSMTPSWAKTPGCEFPGPTPEAQPGWPKADILAPGGHRTLIGHCHFQKLKFARPACPARRHLSLAMLLSRETYPWLWPASLSGAGWTAGPGRKAGGWGAPRVQRATPSHLDRAATPARSRTRESN